MSTKRKPLVRSIHVGRYRVEWGYYMSSQALDYSMAETRGLYGHLVFFKDRK